MHGFGNFVGVENCGKQNPLQLTSEGVCLPTHKDDRTLIVKDLVRQC